MEARRVLEAALRALTFFGGAAFFLVVFFFAGLLEARLVAGFLSLVTFFRLVLVFVFAFFLAAIRRSLPLGPDASLERPTRFFLYTFSYLYGGSIVPDWKNLARAEEVLHANQCPAHGC